MKVTVERDALKDALAAVLGHTKGHGKDAAPIFTHVLIEAADGSLSVTGNDLDSCSRVSLPANIDETGATCLPADQFSRLVTGFAKGSQVALSNDERQAKVKAGRSIYNLPILPAEDFPPSLEVKGGTTIKLSGKQVQRLLGVPLAAASSEETRYYMCGVFVHHAEGAMVAAATDGHKLLRVSISTSAPAFDGVIVPTRAASELVKLATESEVTLTLSHVLIAAECGSRRYVSKLIDGTFPDYSRVIPQPIAPEITVETKELDAALSRLSVARSQRGDIVKLAWDASTSHLKAEERADDGSTGEELIECFGDHKASGEIACQNEYLRKIADALGGENIRLRIEDPGSPIRCENPVDDSIVAVIMPCRW